MTLGGALFDRYIGIDYSGAQAPNSRLKGLRVFSADRAVSPMEVFPSPGPSRYWTRRGIAEWLVARLQEPARTLVGIDHGFSFPIAYFNRYGLEHNWPAFLDDFQQHWPTDLDNTYVEFVREGVCGSGTDRCGDSRWRRLTEVRARTAKSVFHFDCQGSVAKSTHAGLPWLRHIRRDLQPSAVHFWPFDGWQIPSYGSVVVEVYPSLWRGQFPAEGRTVDQHDAYVVAERLRLADQEGRLAAMFDPRLSPSDRVIARIEGWILGVE